MEGAHLHANTRRRKRRFLSGPPINPAVQIKNLPRGVWKLLIEKRNKVSYLGCRIEMTQGMRLMKFLANIRGQTSRHLGFQKTGQDAIHADVSAAVFLREALREADQARFRCSIIGLSHWPFERGE